MRPSATLFGSTDVPSCLTQGQHAPAIYIDLRGKEEGMTLFRLLNIPFYF
jgi:hypothetical protein